MEISEILQGETQPISWTVDGWKLKGEYLKRMEKQIDTTKTFREVPEYYIFSLSYGKRELLLDIFQQR